MVLFKKKTCTQHVGTTSVRCTEFVERIAAYGLQDSDRAPKIQDSFFRSNRERERDRCGGPVAAGTGLCRKTRRTTAACREGSRAKPFASGRFVAVGVCAARRKTNSLRSRLNRRVSRGGGERASRGIRDRCRRASEKVCAVGISPLIGSHRNASETNVNNGDLRSTRKKKKFKKNEPQTRCCCIVGVPVRIGRYFVLEFVSSPGAISRVSRG